ncbi:MAG: hypothetical protein KAR42_14135 [candidate division Zixibacteria bacterium]|nr:hypothetical protein [candidate division Zixibacteria bacterium]
MAIDRNKVINDLSQLKVRGDNNGLIPAFGVLVQQLPANFWNGFSEKILDAAGDDLADAAEGLLENAAAECGYHTGYGIITSEEFNSVVGPMIEEKPEDILHGAYGVFTAWGWANAEITELVPGEKMVVRAYDYYEADVKNPKRPFAYMIRGVSRAFMDLAYSKPYPDGFGKFACEQTKAIEKGDKFAEFVVTKA